MTQQELTILAGFVEKLCQQMQDIAHELTMIQEDLQEISATLATPPSVKGH